MIIPELRLERQAEALAHAQRHWKEAPSAQRPVRSWSIAITREAGTPGAELAEEIGRRLNWPVYDRELVEKIAREMGLRTHLLDALDERHRSWLIEAAQSFTLAGPVSEARFIKQLIETVMSLGAIGHCVIVGRAAAHVLPAENTLRVRLVGVKEDRIAAVERKLNVRTVDAEQWVENTDRQRTRFIIEHFARDPVEPSHYDLVLNTSRWSLAECADLVLDALKKLEARK